MSAVAANTDAETIRVFIVRHGQTDHNVAKILQGHLNTPLNSTGRSQAKKAGKKFEHFQFDSIYSSDLTRCRDTAQLVVESLENPVDIKFTELLRERNMGIMEGKYLHEAIAFAEMEGKNFRDYGEADHEFIQRIAKILNKALTENKTKKNVLLVSHGGTIRSFLKILKYDNKDVSIYNTSVTVVDFNRHDFNIFEVKTVGDTKHLGEGVFKVDSRVR
jgi:probable phosphoglycerate mutase